LSDGNAFFFGHMFNSCSSQLFTEKTPFFNLYCTALPLEVAINGLEPVWPGLEAEARGMTDDIWRLMRSCWRHDPSSRRETILTGLVEFAMCNADSELDREISAGLKFDSEELKISRKITRMRKSSEYRDWFANVWHVELIENNVAAGRVGSGQRCFSLTPTPTQARIFSNP